MEQPEPSSSPPAKKTQFELYEERSPKEALRHFQVTVTERCVQGWNVPHHLGFLPHTSLKDKFPYYK